MASTSLTKLIVLLLALRGQFSVTTKLGEPASQKITTNAQTLAKRITDKNRRKGNLIKVG